MIGREVSGFRKLLRCAALWLAAADVMSGSFYLAQLCDWLAVTSVVSQRGAIST